MRNYYVYIMTNVGNSTLYIGVTNNLERRVQEHKCGSNLEAFTTRYGVNKLVYVELYMQIEDAIQREKQLKGWRRQRKIDLIKEANPFWKDLAKEYC